MSIKTYVLLEHMNPTSNNLFIRTSKTSRQVQNKLPWYRPYLKVTFTDEKGQNKTIRFKSTSNTIFQDEQMKAGIPANEKFRTQEYRALEFRHSVLTTDDQTIQAYLEAYPGFDGFKGKCADVRRPEYTIYDKKAETKSQNTLIQKRIQAGTRIFEMDLEETKNILYRIYGTSYVPSEDIEDNRAVLIEFLDETEEGISLFLEKGESENDNMTILIGKLLTADILSFDKNMGQVSRKVLDQWVDALPVSAEHELPERKRLFAVFLGSEEGQLLRNDLSSDLKKYNETKKEADKAAKQAAKQAGKDKQ